MDNPVVHPLAASSGKPQFLLPLVVVVLVVLGIAAGWLLSRSAAGSSTGIATGSDMVKSATEVGSTNTATYRDTAIGVVEAGGLNGEGTHKLVRDGGPSQTVYLISSVIDLDQYVGKKVELWGLTLDAVKAPWLMDVGRLKLLE